MKLYAIYVGGEHPKANVEVHDMRFVVAPSLRETYAELRQQWWGKPSSLHIDCWAEIDHADGHDVTLRPEPSAAIQKLFFVNLGGYSAGEFLERHKNVFVVAETEAKAKARAIRTVSGWTDVHRDDLYEAEHAFALDIATSPHRLHIHLTPAVATREPHFTCRYSPIGKRGS
jgi:hypothetical protein